MAQRCWIKSNVVPVLYPAWQISAWAHQLSHPKMKASLALSLCFWSHLGSLLQLFLFNFSSCPAVLAQALLCPPVLSHGAHVPCAALNLPCFSFLVVFLLLSRLASPWSTQLTSSLFLCRAEGAVNEKWSKESSTLNRYVLRGQQNVGAQNRADMAGVRGWHSCEEHTSLRLSCFPLVRCTLTVGNYSTAKIFPLFRLFSEGSVFWFASGVCRAEGYHKQLREVKVRASTSLRWGQAFHTADKGLDNSWLVVT